MDTRAAGDAGANEQPDVRFRRSGPVDIAVIVVTYQNENDIDELLSSLRPEAQDQTIRVVVVDNSSADGTVDRVRAHPDVLLVETGANLGYAGGINRAMDEVGQADALLVLNPDLRVVRHCIQRLLARLALADGGIVVPAIQSPSGDLTQSLRREPSLSSRLGDAVFGSRWNSRPGFLSETVRSPTTYESAKRIEWATGAAALISRRTAEHLGPWDERFFLYSEETDYFKRARDAGFPVWFEPSAVVIHREGGSGRSPELVALTVVNAVRYAEKHHPRTASAHRWLLALHELRRWRDPSHRLARTILLDKRKWESLPSGSRGPTASTRIDHVIVTRFNLPSEGAEKLIRAQDGWLRERVELFERYTVPSVRAQSSTGFHWIIYFDTESPSWLLNRLRPLVEEGLFTPLYREWVGWTDLALDARRVTGALGTILITTNLDNDDALATDFVARIQAAAVPGRREALFLAFGLIRAGGRVYLREDRNNAFCSVAEPWEGAQTAWRDWHILLGKHMPTRSVGGAPGWLQVIHGRNVSNRIRGRLVSPERYAALFGDQLGDAPRLGTSELMADRFVFEPVREINELVRVVGKSMLLRVLGKDGLGRLREQIRRVRSR